MALFVSAISNLKEAFYCFEFIIRNLAEQQKTAGLGVDTVNAIRGVKLYDIAVAQLFLRRVANGERRVCRKQPVNGN